MSVNDFIQGIKDTFGAVDFKATSKEGKVFKSVGFDKANAIIEARINTKKYFK